MSNMYGGSAAGVDIREISRQLRTIEEELVAVIPEHLFVAHMLPIISREEGHNDLTPWNHLAGSPFNRVKVVDRDNNVLFELPPMAVSPTLDKDRDSRNSVYEMIETYRMHSKISPRNGQAYLDSRLGEFVKDPQFDYSELRLVDDVLERYNKPRRLPRGFYEELDRRRGVPTEVTASQPEPSIPEEDDIGDDF